MNIFIDDVRDPSFVGWDISQTQVFRTADSAIAYLLPFLRDPGQIISISFDHDLGPSDDATIVALRLEEAAFYGEIKCSLAWQIHSMNPVGSRNLRLILESMDRYIAKAKGA